jgi:hypothetical protein
MTPQDQWFLPWVFLAVISIMVYYGPGINPGDFFEDKENGSDF